MDRRIVAVGVIIILLLGVNVSGGFVKEKKDASTVVFDGNILYVGGSGPNNYTTIQSAIDDALDGDTVFVYNGTYYEYNITIDKSINLIGEDRESTIVNGINSSYIFYVESNMTRFEGFTFINSSIVIWIEFRICYVSIINNIFKDNYCGLGCTESVNRYLLLATHNINVSDNLFSNNSICVGIMTYDSVFSNNVFLDNDEGLYLSYSRNLTIYNNYFSNHYSGVMFGSTCSKVNIINNHFIDNLDGLFVWGSENRIIQNNFINSSDFIEFVRMFPFEIQHKLFYPDFKILSKNTWDGNYWSDYDGNGPYKIRRFFVLFPWYNFDWSPASEPYDIEVL